MKFAQLEKEYRELLKSTITNYYTTSSDKTETVTLVWDSVMSEVKLLIIANNCVS